MGSSLSFLYDVAHFLPILFERRAMADQSQEKERKQAPTERVISINYSHKSTIISVYTVKTIVTTFF